MEDRRFNEVELRSMLELARSFRRNIEANRWVLETHHDKRNWEVIVEPDAISKRLVVVTAYPVWDD